MANRMDRNVEMGRKNSNGPMEGRKNSNGRMEGGSDSEFIHPLSLEDTPAYQVLRRHGLLVNQYRIDNEAMLDMAAANSGRGKNCMLNCAFFPLRVCGVFHTFEVPSAHVRMVKDGRGAFPLYGEGVHLICDPFYSVGGATPYGSGKVIHGDRTIVTVDQGQIGYATDKGQPVLLPPGLHQWRSPTLKYIQAFDLNNNVVRMGPLTLVTVDDGYAAVTEDNGRQHILEGGECYLLTHRNWKFQKFITQKIQSSNLKRITATSADNVLMAVDATVIWRIADVTTAARNSAETISATGSDASTGELGDIKKLTNDVLKQAEASLAAFIGVVNYSDSFNVAASVQKPMIAPNEDDTAPVAPVSNPNETKPGAALFDVTRLRTCIDHANDITATYGVNIISINVVAAVPNDPTLQASLAQGAVAAAEALKFETVARGRAAAAEIEARGEAEAAKIRAKGEADSEELRALGARQAADTIAASSVAVNFAMIDKTGAALDKNKAFFFGGNPSDIGSMLTQPLIAASAASASGGGAVFADAKKSS